MTDIKLEPTPDGNQFTFKDGENERFFEYRPSIAGLWGSIDFEEFDVQLLIHPFLNKENNVFALESIVCKDYETVGYIFPIAALDSNEFVPSRQADNTYLYVAYYVLLQRLRKIKQEANTLGDCFESNICVCVLNLKTIGKEKGLNNCIHSLREKGYSYFTERNGYKPVDGYTYDFYKQLVHGNRIKVTFSIPKLYSDPILDGIIRSLPNADNLVYRFILLYQIVEILISKNITKNIDNLISEYQKSAIKTENDFLESINGVRKERDVVRCILESCQIEQSEFNNACKQLLSVAGIPQPKDPLFYSFRNQMVHSYRHLYNYKSELAYTIFYFEQIVLSVVERYSEA